MTRAERLAILGAATVAEIHQRVAKAPPPSPQLVDDLRLIFAPALRELRQERAAEPTRQPLLAA
jgi:hypothetical protein